MDVQLNVTTAGSFNITTNTVYGYSFTFSGNLAVGTQTVTLVGTGIPTAAGSNLFTVTVPGTPASTCTFTVTVQPPPDYFPRTANSNWSYEFDDIANDSLYIRALSNTITALGNPFVIFMETADISGGFDSSGYYRKSGNDYFQWLNLQDLGFDNPLWAELNFLKDNQAVGFSWTTNGYSGTVGGQPFTIRFRYTITSQNTTVSVTTSAGTTPYPNTIVVKEEIEQFTGGIWVPMTSVAGYNENYFSRNIGLIQQYYYNGSGVLTTKFEMRRYQVF